MIKYVKALLVLILCAITHSSFAASSCSAGYYLSNSQCIICPVGYYCTGGTTTARACTGTTYADKTGQSSCTACPEAVKYASIVSMYHYWTFSGEHDSISGCHAFFSTTDVPHGSVEATQMLCYIGSDKDYGVSTSTCQVLLESFQCDAGYWNPQHDMLNYAYYDNYQDMYDGMCVPVEPGYYSPADVLTRTACPDGEITTGYGIGADEINDCGHDLVLGENTLHLRREQRTTPSLQVLHNGKVYYGDADPTRSKGNLHISDGSQIYTVYDDTI